MEVYIMDKLRDNRGSLTNLGANILPSILKAEVEKAVHQTNINKACEPDQQYSQWFKLSSASKKSNCAVQ